MIFKRWSRKGDTPGTFRKLYYYDDLHPLRYLCMSWVYGWVDYIAKGKCDLESLHPLPKADRLSEWQQTFSKYISDGVLQLELTESRASESTSKGQKNSCNHTIFLRAMVLTFWRRGLLTLLGSVCVSIISMTTAILLKYLFDILSSDSEMHTRSLGKIAAIVMVVVLVESLHSTLDQHVQLYVSRLQICMEASIAITLFQHGLCYRRNYSLTLKSRDNMESCNRVLHYNDGFENKCSRNSLSCPAQRHQNRELPPSMYTHMVLDATAITLAVDSVISLVKFLCSFISGVAFVKAVMDFPILLPTITIVIAVVSMIFIELINGSLRNYSLESVDSRIAVSSDVLGNLELCTAMGVDDVCYRSIEYSRQDELSVLRISLFLRFLSRSVERSVGIVLFWVFVFVFNREVTRVEPGGALKFQLSELISLIFIITNIVVSCKHLPRAFRQFIESATSYGRVESFLRNCSPNFYLDISLDENDTERVGQQTVPSEMSADTLVYFKDVSFSYYSTRKQLLDEASPNTMPLLKSLNFILKRKDICIITGNQGSGKTSFIKSILGEMTLVSGSMAVAPLSTGMPIFYSSQDIWLPRGTIRSVITFGYTFDEEVYNQVLRSVELESDIQSWPDGDSRVISEQGYSLSGGQRVRVGLARALYAYMIFSKANEQLENRCCFLMCLDEPLEGLDMVVCQTIIYRLFNRIDGLLVRDDVAVVMSISNMSLDIGMLRDSPKSLVKMGIYVIEDNQLRELEAIGYERNPVENKTNSISDLPKETNAYHSFNRMSQRLSCGTLLSLKMNDPVSPNDLGNMDDAQSNSQECDNTTFSYTWSAYRVYLNAVSHLLFTVLMIFLGLSNVMVNLKLLVTARWVDGMRRVKSSESIAALMSHHQIHYFWITLLTLSSLVCFVILIFSVVTTSLKGSRCIHTFAIKSIFQRTFGEFEFKERIGSLMTFLTSDIHIIDEMIASYLYESTFSLLAFLIKLASLFYIVPVAVPVPLVTFLVLYFCVHRKVLRSAKILQRLMLDANSNVNSVYNEVISGSSIYRSFCKERMWLNDVRLRSEEYYRTLFLKAAYTTWVSLITRLSVSVMIAIFIAIPILRSYLGHTELNVAHLGVGMSMCLGFGHSLQWLIINYAHLEKYMCSVRRFEDFFLKEGVSLKQKFESMDESIISGSRSPDSSNIRQIGNEIGAGHSNGIQYSEIDKSDPSVTLEINEIQNVIYDDAEVMEQLLHRRRMEYRLFQFRRYTSVYGWFLYKPRIDMLDASPYLSPNTTLELRGVAVVADSSDDSINKVYRLKPISSGAVKGDVIGIIGRTGAGKSTLLSVIQNVVPGRLGSVMLNGHDINMIPRRILRHLIGVLPQLPYIFKGWTLRRFVDPRMMYCDDEIMDSIERCGLTDLVNVFSRSEILDTVLISDNITARRRLFLAAPLGPLTSNPCEQCTCIILNPESSNDRQVLLSSSQQRQLMFARLVLYRNTFRILLIDEPPWTNNGALDIEDMPSAIASEQSINSLVRRYFSHCITFIVAHDRHALQCCSRLWYVQDGHVSEDKSVEELLNEHFTDTPNM